jgi:peptide deformylase
MDIVLYPDPRLRAKNTPVQDFGPELEVAVRDMFQLMYQTQGVGLAAPQVGLNIRMMVFNPEGEAEATEAETVLCNPRIVSKGKDKDFAEEGCLSFPEINGQVSRPIRVTVEAQNLQGQEIRLELEGWAARVFQHEFDHLEGVLFIDRMSPADRTLIKQALAELERDYLENA